MSRPWWGTVVVMILGAVPASLSAQAGSGEGGPQEGPLTLTQAVAMALESHPLVGQAQALGEVARARVTQARAARLPLLAGQGSLTRHQEPMIVAPLHGFDPTRPPDFDRNLVQGGLSLSYTLFDGGARGARIDEAQAGERMAGAGGQEAAMGLTVQVGSAFLGVLSGTEELAAVQGQKEALEAELERVRLFLEEGKAAQVDLLRVQAALSRVEAQEITVRSDLDLARGRLARLTGMDPSALARQALAGVEAPTGTWASAPTARAAALEENAGIQRAREEVVGAAAGVRAAQAAWLPRVEATGRYMDFGTLEGGHVLEWQGALQLSYPLFTGGGREGERDRARAEERRARETLRLAELEVEDEVEAALAAVGEAAALREALAQAAAQSQEVARIETLALEAGAGVQTDFLGAQAELFQARAALARARHGEVLARLQLARVMGELSLAWIEANMEMVR